MVEEVMADQELITKTKRRYDDLMKKRTISKKTKVMPASQKASNKVATKSDFISVGFTALHAARWH